MSGPGAEPHPVSLARGGLIALAAAMGIGRFASLEEACYVDPQQCEEVLDQDV